MTDSPRHDLNDDQLLALVRRMDLFPSLVRRHLEEEITRLVDLPLDFLEQSIVDFCGDKNLESLLIEKGWTESDLHMHVLRPEDLRRFAEQRFGPGLEERFLSFQGGCDQVIYSLLRVRDAGLARELLLDDTLPAHLRRRGDVFLVHQRVLEGSALLVVLGGAVMQRRGEAVLDHLLFLQVPERRMQLLEVGEIVEHSLDDGVDHLFWNICRGDNRGAHTKGCSVIRRAGIHATRNGGHTIEGIVGNQLVDRSSGDGYEFHVAGGRGFGNSGRRVTDGVDHRIDLAVAECLSHFRTLELSCYSEITHLHAKRIHDHFHSCSLA